MEWVTILSQPITQVGVVASILWGLQKSGFDVKGAILSLLRDTTSKDAAVKEVNADNRNSLQTVLSTLEVRMTELAQYANHDTTALLTRIADKLGEMHDCIKTIKQTLNEQDKFGVKIRKE